MAGVCFIFLIVCYGKIFAEVYKSGNLRQQRLRQLTTTTILLLGAFLFCWIPVMLLELVMFILARYQLYHIYADMLRVHTVLKSIMLSYPLIDPLIYAARLTYVQK